MKVPCIREYPLVATIALFVTCCSILGCEESMTPVPEVVRDTVLIVNTDTIVVTKTVTEFQYVFLECAPDIIETESLTQVVIQAECAEIAPSWFIRRSIGGFTGAGYIIWEGFSNFSGDDAGRNGRLTYRVPIPKAGTYRFNWRSYIGKYDQDNPTTEHNDSWLSIPGAADFYGKKDADFVYPVGSGRTPNPEGSSGNGFFKVYMNREDEWSDQSKTSDNNGFEIFARFDTVGIYTVEIDARSAYHAIDKFLLTLME